MKSEGLYKNDKQVQEWKWRYEQKDNKDIHLKKTEDIYVSI